MKLGKLIISAHSIWLFMKLCVMKQILMISNQKPNSMSKLRYHSLLDTPSNFLRDLTKMKIINLVGWLCLTSHRQRGHLETAPPFTVPCEGREAR